MDGATNLANDDFYLDNHLKAVIANNTRQNQVEIYGVGVGLDMSPYYPRSLAIDVSQGLDNRVFDEVAQLLRGHYWHLLGLLEPRASVLAGWEMGRVPRRE